MAISAINPAISFGNNQNSQKTKTRKSNTTGKAVALVTTAAAITAGVVYRKNIMKFIKGLFRKQPEFKTIYDPNMTGLSKETKGIIRKEIVNMHGTETLKAKEAARQAELEKMREDAIEAFKNFEVQA